MRRDIALISGVFALHFIRYGIIFPFIPLYAEDIGASPMMIGLIVAAFSLLSLFLAVPAGGLTDIIGVKQMLVTGVICNIVNVALLLRAESVAMLIAAQLAGGLGFQLHIVPSQTYISRLSDAAQREAGFGYLTFGASVGQMIGPVLGGALATQYGYHTAFLTSLIISFGGFAILFLQEQYDMELEDKRYSFSDDLEQARTMLANSQMAAVLFLPFVMIFAVSLRRSFLPVLLRTRGFQPSYVGLLIAVFAGTSTLIRPFVGRLLRRYSRRQLLALAVLAAMVGVGAAPLLASPLTIGLALGLFGLGFGLTQPLSMVMVADLISPEHSGLAMGVRYTALTMGNLLGPVILGSIVEWRSLEASFFITAAVVAAMGVFLVGLNAQLLPGRREEQVEVSSCTTDD